MDKQKIKQYLRSRRAGRVRAKVSGTSKCPRLSVFKSNKGMYLQLIDDENSKTLVSAHSSEVKSSSVASSVPPADVGRATEGKKVAVSFELGKLIAGKASAKKIKQIVFDRGGYKYHGRVKAAADGAREEG